MTEQKLFSVLIGYREDGVDRTEAVDEVLKETKDFTVGKVEEVSLKAYGLQ